MSVVIAIDAGTTGVRSFALRPDGTPAGYAYREFTQHFPAPGLVEHDPDEIWAATEATLAELSTRLAGETVAAVGITNQRETAVVWDKNTGEPVYNAIVWQDTRTDKIVDELGNLGGGQERYRAKTGLPLATYFSGPKVKWILDNVDGAREKAEAGDLLFGNMDTWVAWNTTGGVDGGLHITDPTNASRTLLYDIHSGDWDAELCAMLDVPRAILPAVAPSSGRLATADATVLGAPVPIAGIAGDQQAALFGQLCTSPGLTKNTYGTGCFMLQMTGEKAPVSKNKLLTTVAWKRDGRTQYALEGSVFVGGAVV
ncbi:MAG: FGGY family carbohydrate kinase, partial [Acidimicrobiales bacterium]